MCGVFCCGIAATAAVIAAVSVAAVIAAVSVAAETAGVFVAAEAHGESAACAAVPAAPAYAAEAAFVPMPDPVDSGHVAVSAPAAAGSVLPAVVQACQMVFAFSAGSIVAAACRMPGRCSCLPYGHQLHQ